MIYYNPIQNKIIESKNIYIVYKNFGKKRTKKVFYIENNKKLYLQTDLIVLR